MKRKVYIETSIISLAEELIIANILPPKAAADALHIATATLHRQEKITAFFENKGLLLPVICTPEELLGAEYDE
ncbi:MAG: hypothetical protein KDJ22_05735 [Candidatus Competibacteraceae bacterium]|nr:hypothetical protein [Candidatus Competibacteraceae bacterium]MCP5124141.1 hypothetical protein [Gammaproteobacteria bacterium]HRX71508.1 hypothetical protein [Candidatus Competibacteraceae bacterium]